MLVSREITCELGAIFRRSFEEVSMVGGPRSSCTRGSHHDMMALAMRSMSIVEGWNSSIVLGLECMRTGVASGHIDMECSGKANISTTLGDIAAGIRVHVGLNGT